MSNELSESNFADNIRRFLEINAISQKDFAHALGVSDASVSVWIGKKTAPSNLETIYSISYLTGLSMHDLFSKNPNIERKRIRRDIGLNALFHYVTNFHGFLMFLCAFRAIQRIAKSSVITLSEFSGRIYDRYESCEDIVTKTYSVRDIILKDGIRFFTDDGVVRMEYTMSYTPKQALFNSIYEFILCSYDDDKTRTYLLKFMIEYPLDEKRNNPVLTIG